MSHHQLLPGRYIGRFAPSPTGPLHFGSLIAALASYLDARAHNGQWKVRIDDLDKPRTIPGASQDILTTLERFGFEWDDMVMYQSHRTQVYEEALHQLRTDGEVYDCGCSRKEIAEQGLNGPFGSIYPGTCRNGLPSGKQARALRCIAPKSPVCLDDRLQGTYKMAAATGMAKGIENHCLVRKRSNRPVLTYLRALPTPCASVLINPRDRLIDSLRPTDGRL